MVKLIILNTYAYNSKLYFLTGKSVQVGLLRGPYRSLICKKKVSRGL